MLIRVILVVAPVQSDDEMLRHPGSPGTLKQSGHRQHDQVRIKTASRFHKWYEISRDVPLNGESVAGYRSAPFQSAPGSADVFAKHASRNDVIWLHRKVHSCHPT